MGLFNKKTTAAKDTEATVKKSAKKSESISATESKPKPVKEAKSKSEKSQKMAYRILIRPLISEKATIGVSLNKYVFEVAPDANKVEIKKAIEEIYGIVPSSVNVLNKSGKNVRFGRYQGRTKSIKKAVVTLKKGDSIKLYEGI